MSSWTAAHKVVTANINSGRHSPSHSELHCSSAVTLKIYDSYCMFVVLSQQAGLTSPQHLLSPSPQCAPTIRQTTATSRTVQTGPSTVRSIYCSKGHESLCQTLPTPQPFCAWVNTYYRRKHTWKANVLSFAFLCGCLKEQDGLCWDKPGS